MTEDENQSYPNIILKKIVENCSIKFENGTLSVWNIPGILMPLNTYVLFENLMIKKFGKEAKDLLYYLIKEQSIGGMKALMQQ